MDFDIIVNGRRWGTAKMVIDISSDAKKHGVTEAAVLRAIRTGEPQRWHCAGDVELRPAGQKAGAKEPEITDKARLDFLDAYLRAHPAQFEGWIFERAMGPERSIGLVASFNDKAKRVRAVLDEAIEACRTKLST